VCSTKFNTQGTANTRGKKPKRSLNSSKDSFYEAMK